MRLYAALRMRDAHYNMVERLGVAYFDVNGLKQVNDTLGHRAGDDLIARSARHIKRYFSDKGYRIGGDEFVIIDTETNRDEFERKIAQVCRDMADDNISIAMGQSFRYAGCNLEEQFEHADKRMYNAKAKHYQERANDRRKR